MMASKNFSFVLILPFFISLKKGSGWRLLKLFHWTVVTARLDVIFFLFLVSRKEGRGLRNIKISFNGFYINFS